MNIRQNLALLKRVEDTKRLYWRNMPALPYKLALSVTNKCNCRCKICNVWQVYQREPALVDNELLAAEYEKFFKTNNRDFYWIAITGGEPFLRNDFLDILNIIFKNCRNLVLLSIVTNGILTEQIVRIMEKIAVSNPKVKIYIVISIDGDQDTHEHIRGQKGIYKNILNTIAGLETVAKKHKNLNLRLETIISPYNLQSINNFIETDLIKKHKLSFAFAQESDRYFNKNDKVELQKENIDNINTTLAKIIKKTSGFAFEQLIMRLFYKLSLNFFRDPGHQVIPCYASWASIYLGPWGEIRPCIMLEPSLNIKEHGYNISQIIRTKSWQEIQHKIKTDMCPRCWTPCEAMQTMIQHVPKIFFI